MTARGEVKGPILEPRELARLCYEAGWHDAQELSTAVKVCLAESQGGVNSLNDNFDANGDLLSRDVGLFQINIPADRVGTVTETSLYKPDANVAAAYDLWQRRSWQPWVAYTTNVCNRDTYLRKAARGIGNYLASIDLSKSGGTLANGDPYQHTLTHPVTDYYYRVDFQARAIVDARAHLSKLKPLLTSPANQARVDEIQKILANGRAWVDKAYP